MVRLRAVVGVMYWLTGNVVCGILTRYDPDEDEEPQVDEVFPIAGSYATTSGRSLDPKYERLEDIPYSDMTGLRIELNGGKYNKQNQKAVIDMQCDPERTGNEKSPFKKGKGDEDEKLRETETDENDEANSLRFVSYEVGDDSKDIKVLRLDWRTKYACESYEEDDDEGSEKDSDGKHWGFFTWFIVMYVLSVHNSPALRANANAGGSASTASSLAYPPISFLDPGSTTTATAPEDGIFFPMATQSETYPTCSETGQKE